MPPGTMELIYWGHVDMFRKELNMSFSPLNKRTFMQECLGDGRGARERGFDQSVPVTHTWSVLIGQGLPSWQEQVV